VPDDAAWLTFHAWGGWIPGQTTISFAGQDLSPIAIRDPSDPDSYAVHADISTFAGDTGELRFTFRAIDLGGGAWLGGVLYLDDIQFAPVPEPHVWALFGLGALALTLARRRRKRP
jgi:hypothetical protein